MIRIHGRHVVKDNSTRKRSINEYAGKNQLGVEKPSWLLTKSRLASFQPSPKLSAEKTIALDSIPSPCLLLRPAGVAKIVPASTPNRVEVLPKDTPLGIFLEITYRDGAVIVQELVSVDDVIQIRGSSRISRN